MMQENEAMVLKEEWAYSHGILWILRDIVNLVSLNAFDCLVREIYDG